MRGRNVFSISIQIDFCLGWRAVEKGEGRFVDEIITHDVKT